MSRPTARAPRFTKILLGLSVFVLIAGGFLFSQVFCKPVAASCDTAPATSGLAEQSVTVIAPRYWEYSEYALTKAQTLDSKVVLYFWAPWCSTCSSLDDQLTHNIQQIPENVIVLRINYDQSPDLKQKYNVVIQHTFVQIDKNGNLLATWVGGELDTFPQHLQ